jgi:hypothetical protein
MIGGGLLVGHRRLVDPPADEGVVDVGQRHQAGRQGDGVARQLLG